MILIYFINLLKLTSKILISKSWWVVVSNKLEDFFLDSIWTFPVTPKPFRNKSGHTEDAKMDKDTNFGIVIPLRNDKQRI